MSDLFWPIVRTEGGMNTKIHGVTDAEGSLIRPHSPPAAARQAPESGLI